MQLYHPRWHTIAPKVSRKTTQMCPCFTAGVGVEFPQVNLSNSCYPNCFLQAQMTLFCPCEEAQLVRAVCVWVSACVRGWACTHTHTCQNQRRRHLNVPLLVPTFPQQCPSVCLEHVCVGMWGPLHACARARARLIPGPNTVTPCLSYPVNRHWRPLP